MLFPESYTGTYIHVPDNDYSGANLFQEFIRKKLFPSKKELREQYKKKVFNYFGCSIGFITIFYGCFLWSNGFTFFDYIIEGSYFGIEVSLLLVVILFAFCFSEAS